MKQESVTYPHFFLECCTVFWSSTGRLQKKVAGKRIGRQWEKADTDIPGNLSPEIGAGFPGSEKDPAGTADFLRTI